jgi:NADH-quinone oxidoreductase subunit L
VSAYSAAVFHLMTHAFFKALLFLGAGSVIIAMHHEQDMRRMGGLRKYMPVTFATMWIGTLALTGMPLLSGFYSKDTIIEAAAEHAHAAGHTWVATYGYWAVLLGVFVTAFYSFRLLYLTFHGRERFRDPAPAGNGVGHEEAELEEAHAAHAVAHGAMAHDTHDDAHAGDAGHDDHAHDDHGHHGPVEPRESPLVVTIPLVLLAIPSLLIGGLTVGPMLFGHFFDGAIVISPMHEAMAKLGEEFHEFGAFGPLKMAAHGVFSWPFVSWPFWLAFSGFALATWFYLIDPSMPGKAARVFAWPIRVLEDKYGFDDLWIKGFAGGGLGLGRFASRFGDAGLIDGVFVNGSAWVVDRVASMARRLQSGYLYHYAFAMILGLIVLLAMLARMGH